MLEQGTLSILEIRKDFVNKNINNSVCSLVDISLSSIIFFINSINQIKFFEIINNILGTQSIAGFKSVNYSEIAQKS